MSDKEVTVRLPVSLYERLQAVAEASGRSLPNVLLQSVKNGMPPSLQKVPDKFHGRLLSLNKLDDQSLWRVVQGNGDDEDQSEEAQRMDLTTLRRAYAAALLKWRGHPIPDPTEFLL
jgi:hypothetical protein